MGFILTVGGVGGVGDGWWMVDVRFFFSSFSI